MRAKDGRSLQWSPEFLGRDYGDLPEDTMARGPRVTKLAGSTVSWSDLLNRLTGKVPFLLRPAILKSDEAIEQAP